MERQRMRHTTMDGNELISNDTMEVKSLERQGIVDVLRYVRKDDELW